jgi:8-oxo-dGTP pyrophosphatase MutT (NUDIX family)
MLGGFIQHVRRFGITNLPGIDAQKELVSKTFSRSRTQANKNSKRAGVLAIILDVSTTPSLLYIKRTTKRNDKHSGQISFPGGQYEDGDKTLLQCALRETKEEVGIQGADLQILGPLTPLYVDVSDFVIHPYLAFYDAIPDYELEEEEVAHIIEFPIAELLEEESIKYTDMTIRNHKLKNIPYFDLNGEILWGATAMITNEILHLIRSHYKS